MIAITLGVCCVALAVASWRLNNRNTFLQKENELLKTQLQEAIQKLAEFEPSSDLREDGLFQRAVEGLVALGVPGLVLVVAVAVNGYAGAAALTTALAALGGPWGMVGGIGVLLLLVPVSKALTRYGLTTLAQAVVRGLVSKGESPLSIKAKIDKVPRWALAANLRTKIIEFSNQASQVMVVPASRPLA